MKQAMGGERQEGMANLEEGGEGGAGKRLRAGDRCKEICVVVQSGS